MQNQEAFLEILKAGLFPFNGSRCMIHGTVDWGEVYRLAEEQSVVGLVTAGLEFLDEKRKPSQVEKLQFVGESLQIEQRNKTMNKWIADIVDKMRASGIYTLLVKGQGVAQCYEKPLWRKSGDVDLLLSQENYEKAKEFLLPLSSNNKHEERYSQHLGMNIGEWYVEIHGSMRSGLSERVDTEIDRVQKNVFYGGNVRSWENEKTQVFLPRVDDDVFFVFTHFIKHFYKERLGLRQVCDWCRLLWTYREKVDASLLEKRLCRSGLMSEWHGFAAMAVEYLGMPAYAMPLLDVRDKTDDGRCEIDKRWKRKADKIMELILSGYSGNKYRDTLRIARIYPWNTMKFLPGILWHLNWLKIKERLLPHRW